MRCFAMRPRGAPIVALCLNVAVAGSLALHRAVHPVVLPWDEGNPDEAVDAALTELARAGHLETGDTVVVVTKLMMMCTSVRCSL